MRRAQHKNVSPVLGCSRDAPYTAADLCKDIQVYHQSNPHHQNIVYNNISPEFVHSIQLQDDASNIYNSRMKNLHMDELEHSLNLYRDKQIQFQNERDGLRKQYKENVNGLVLALEQDKARRYEGLKFRIQRQQQRQNRFVNAEELKNRRIDDYISNTEFNTQLRRAREEMKTQHNKSLSHVRQPLPNFLSISTNEVRNSSNCRPAIAEVSHNKCTSNRFECGSETRQKLDGEKIHRILRVHNPITNPIQYHIDNPYFIKKMQIKYSGQ